MNFKAFDVVRSVFVYIAGNLRALVLVSVVPGVVTALLKVVQSWLQYERVLEVGIERSSGDHPLPDMAGIIQNIMLMLVILPVYFWFCVKVIRLRLLGEGGIGLASNEELSCTYRYGLYMLAIMGVILAIGAGVLLAAVMLLGGGGDAKTTGFVFIFVFLLMATSLMYANIRFSAALPGVAVGLRPNIIKDMWPFAREIAWPLLGWLIVVFLGFSVFFMFINAALLGDAVNAMKAGPQAYLQYLEANMAKMVLVNLVFSLISIPFYWFYTLYFAEAFERIAVSMNIWRAPG